MVNENRQEALDLDLSMVDKRQQSTTGVLRKPSSFPMRFRPMSLILYQTSSVLIELSYTTAHFSRVQILDTTTCISIGPQFLR